MIGLVRQMGSALIWRGFHLGTIRAVSLLQILVLARILKPQDFGLWSVAAVTVWAIQQVSDFGLVPALVQHPTPDQEHYRVAWTLRIIRGLGIGLVVMLSSPLIAGLFEQTKAIPLLAVMAWRPLLEATTSIRVAELTRKLNFRSLAGIYVPAIALEAVVSITMAPWIGVWAFAVGALAGTISAVGLSYMVAPWKPQFSLSRQTSVTLIRYGRWIFLSGLVAVAGNYVLRVVVSRQLGAAELGIYFLAAKLAFLPSDMASKLVGEVSFPLYSRLQSDRQALTRAWRAILSSTFVVLVPVMAMILALAPVIPLVLGDNWQGVAPIARILVIAGLLGLFGDTIVPVLKGLGQPQKVTILEAIQSGIIATLVSFMVAKYDLPGAALIWLPAMFVSFFLNNLFATRLLVRYWQGTVQLVLVIGFSAALGASIAWYTPKMIPGISGIIISCLAGGGVYLLFISLLNWIFKLGLWSQLLILWPQIPGIQPKSKDESC